MCGPICGTGSARGKRLFPTIAGHPAADTGRLAPWALRSRLCRLLLGGGGSSVVERASGERNVGSSILLPRPTKKTNPAALILFPDRPDSRIGN